MESLRLRPTPCALICGLCCVLGLFAAASPAQTMPPPADQKLAPDIFRQFIEIKSGYTTGSTTSVAEAAAARLRAAGFPDSDIFLGGANLTKQNLVVRLHGTGAHKPILLLVHEDVVEAKREDWSADLDPYILTEKDGYFYGRGTFDDKDQEAVWIANIIRMKREGFVSDRDYGIQGFFMDREDIRFHGRDERLLITNLYAGQQFLYDPVKTLATSN